MGGGGRDGLGIRSRRPAGGEGVGVSVRCGVQNWRGGAEGCTIKNKEGDGVCQEDRNFRAYAAEDDPRLDRSG